MKIVHQKQAVTRNNSDVCVVTEYPELDEEIDFAIVTVMGRYPEKGCAVNQLCKEIVYIQSGQGKIVVNEVEYPLVAGDLVLVEASEKFFWEGHLTLMISCRPSFKVDQHQLVD